MKKNILKHLKEFFIPEDLNKPEVKEILITPRPKDTQHGIVDDPQLPPPPPKPKKPKPKPKPKPVVTEKEIKTLNKEPWVGVVDFNYDCKTGVGFYKFDWNDYFIDHLKATGFNAPYLTTEAQLVDRWYTWVCGQVYNEIITQQETDPIKARQIKEALEELDKEKPLKPKRVRK